MTCREIREHAALYLSRELPAVERDAFALHLAGCPECRDEMEAQIRLDQRVAQALSGELPSASRVEQRFRKTIAAERRRRIVFTAMAGAVAAGIAVVALLSRPAPPPVWFADAARDHRIEIVEGQARRWRTSPAEIEAITAQNGLSYAQAAALAAPGYALERAKNCGVGGRRTLHLVFSDGAREYSVYVSAHAGPQENIRVAHPEGQQVAGFETGRFRAAVVTGGAAADCEAFARVIASRL